MLWYRIEMTSNMKQVCVIFFIILPSFSFGYNNITTYINDDVDQRVEFLVDLIRLNLKPNGWSNIICIDHDFPDYFYVNIKSLPLTFTIYHPGATDTAIADVVPYYFNMVILNCMDFDAFEDALRQAMASPHWHPHANTILYYHTKGPKDIPKIFMIFWFYKICNAIVIQYEDDTGNFLVSLYNPYVGENYGLSHQYGCWKTTKIGRTVAKFQKSFDCVEGCHNVSLLSNLRNLFLGTCIGYDTLKIHSSDKNSLKNISLFEDKAKNLHGFVFKGQGGEVLPFLTITEFGNGNYSLESRDGMIWNTAAERMNFTINLDASKDVLKTPFDFNVNIRQIYSFARRQADVVIFPIYQFDIIIAELDLSIAYKDSGVCILSHRAGFETVLFDAKLLLENTEFFIRFSICFVLVWLLFFIFSSYETGTLSFDQAGKDLVNTIRSVLSISLHKPPKGSFRIYLIISMWCFFIINFATQAAIISFFTAYKRGKEVETFDDVLEKGYVIEGMPSPDMMLPDDEERFVEINSRIISLPNLYGCVEQMSNDSRRFCLIDCSVGRYLERNRLDENGEQYLHVAKDRIHSHYLVMILHKHSPLTNTFNRYLRMFFEAGLIKKWEQYRFSYIMLDEFPLKALNLEDLIGIFKCFYFSLAISSAVFVIEILIGILKRMRSFITWKYQAKIVKYERTRVAKKKLKAEKKLGKINKVNSYTQTV